MLKTPFFIKLLLPLLVFSAVLPLTAAPLKIGWEEKDISTDMPVKVFGGFSLRVAEGTYDKLTVTALAIDNGLDSVIFLSCDTLNINGSVVRNIRRLAKKLAPDCPVNKIIMNATHSHTSGGLDKGRGQVPDGINVTAKGEYRQLFIRAAAEAVAGAWKKRSPGQVAWGYGYAVTGFSRRTIFSDDLSKRPGYDEDYPVMNGHGRMHGAVSDPRFSHFEAGMDPFANYLFTYDPEGKLTGAIINLSTTAQCGCPEKGKLSADFWHETRLALRREHGNIYILPQCAAAGDIVPGVQNYKKAQQRRFKLKYGDKTDNFIMARRLEVTEQIRISFAEVLEWASKDKRHSLPLIHYVSELALPHVKASPELVADLQEKYDRYSDAMKTATFSSPAEEMKKKTFNRTRLGKYKRVINSGLRQEQSSMELHAVRLGDIAFVNNPFELFIDYMHRIQGRSPFTQTFVIQLSAGEQGSKGYLPTRRAIANMGYSAEPFSYRVSPEGGDIMVEETVRQLKMLHKSRQDRVRKKSPKAKARATVKKAPAAAAAGSAGK